MKSWGSTIWGGKENLRTQKGTKGRTEGGLHAPPLYKREIKTHDGRSRWSFQQEVNRHCAAEGRTHTNRPELTEKERHFRGEREATTQFAHGGAASGKKERLFANDTIGQNSRKEGRTWRFIPVRRRGGAHLFFRNQLRYGRKWVGGRSRARN